MQDFKKLRVWEAARRLTLDVHRVCRSVAYKSCPGLRAQILRSASSIAANIAEGTAKSGAEFRRFLEIAVGSAKELENHLVVSLDLGLITVAEFDELTEQVDHVRRMLIALIRAIRLRSNTVRR